MSELSKKALAGVIRFQAFLALLLFVPAGTLRYWEAWLYWGLFFASVLALTVYFLRHDPRLVERRLAVGPAAEGRKSQKVIQGVASVLMCALFVIPGLEHRLRGSGPAVATPIVLTADALVLAAFLGFFLVFRVNSYTSSVVRVEGEQRVISSGPYRLVRHPLYAAATLLFLATPVALGSLYAFLAAVPLCLTMVVRLLDEERALSAELPGYDEYRRKVRYRLIPLVW